MNSMRLWATLILSAMTAGSVRLEAQPSPPPAVVPLAPAAGILAPPATNTSGPMIQFDNVMYDFGKAAAGEKVEHTYIVTNTGDQTLEISNVSPGCHCTTAGAWTHRIEPGHTGIIPIRLDSSLFNGPVTKSISVTSNAKNQPRMALLLKGTVWKPIDVRPSIANMSIPADSTNSQSATVRIVNQTDDPITVSPPTSANQLFTAALKEIKPGKEFELVITAQPPFTAGNVMGTISMKTSLASSPVINVTASAYVVPAVQVYPAQIMLNASPDHWFTNRITIRGSTTNVLTLSNPTASDSRIELRLEPMTLKGMYNLMAAFPPGFQLQPGQTAEVTVQSNHPRYPVIKIPIIQVQRAKVPVNPTGRFPTPQNPIHVTNQP
jgi:hypothetical protein